MYALLMENKIKWHSTNCTQSSLVDKQPHVVVISWLLTVGKLLYIHYRRYQSITYSDKVKYFHPGKFNPAVPDLDSEPLVAPSLTPAPGATHLQVRVAEGSR